MEARTIEKMTRKELLVKEYEQAGEACRNHDSLIRTGITIFGAAQAAILAIIVGQSEPNICYTFALEILGFWLSIVVLATTYRLGHRYANYMTRAKKLEETLGFILYTHSQAYFESKRHLSYMPGNKTTLATLPAVMAFIYGGFIFVHLNKFIEAIRCGGC